MSDETVHLTRREARSLAWRILVRHMKASYGWLHWEDYPMLDEASWRLVVEEMAGNMTDTTRHVSAIYDRQWSIDAGDLEERARG